MEDFIKIFGSLVIIEQELTEWEDLGVWQNFKRRGDTKPWDGELDRTWHEVGNQYLLNE